MALLLSNNAIAKPAATTTAAHTHARPNKKKESIPALMQHIDQLAVMENSRNHE